MNFFGSYGPDESKALALLEPTVDEALKAHESGDYAAYLALVTDALAAKLSADGFNQAYEEVAPTLGSLQSKRFLGAVRRSDNPMLIYAAQYAKQTDDILIHVMFKDGLPKPKIEWLWIE